MNTAPLSDIRLSNFRHFQRRWNERYGEAIGECSRALHDILLEKIWFGESQLVAWGLGWPGPVSIEEVELNGGPVYVLYDRDHHDLVSAIPPTDLRVRGYLKWKQRRR